MTSTGRVVAVDQATPPNSDDTARRVTVAKDPDQTWRDFYIPLTGPAPTVGASVSWGPHHVWWDGCKVKKTHEYDPNGDLL